MKGFTKKILSVVVALTMVIGLATTASAATWTGYFGNNDGSFWEGATGSMTKNTANAFTAGMTNVGWGGVWGCQVYQPIKMTKGTQYNVSFTAKSSNVNKFIYVKMATVSGTTENLAKGFWVKLPRGKNVNVSQTFKAACNANQITFGLGGECGDREGSDQDATVRYKIFDQQFGSGKHLQLVDMDCDGDFAAATNIIVTNYSLVAAPGKVTLGKVKAAKKKKVKVSWKKTANAAGYEVMVGKVKKTTTKTSITVKAKKKGKQAVKVRAYSVGKKVYGAWSKTKKVKVK